MKKLGWRCCRSVVVAVFFLGGCATSGGAKTSTLVQEIAVEDGIAAEELALPTQTFEYLVRFDPPRTASSRLDWSPLRVRLRMAQPGSVRFTAYLHSSLEQPGEVLATFVRDYPAEMAAGADESRWVVESLDGIGATHGPIWIGVRKESGNPKVWAASSNGSRFGASFVRDLDPGRLLSPMPVKRAPMLRLDWGVR